MLKNNEYAQRCELIADGYYRTADMIDCLERDVFRRMLMFNSPYITNLAFACELYLKAILQAEDNPQHGHYLDELYNHLSVQAKTKIEANYNNLNSKHGMSFNDCLIKHRNSYCDWRYSHEKNKRGSCIPLALKDLAISIREYCNMQEETDNAD